MPCPCIDVHISITYKYVSYGSTYYGIITPDDEGASIVIGSKLNSLTCRKVDITRHVNFGHTRMDYGVSRDIRAAF